MGKCSTKRRLDLVFFGDEVDEVGISCPVNDPLPSAYKGKKKKRFAGRFGAQIF
jgi:hypothetical protein